LFWSFVDADLINLLYSFFIAEINHHIKKSESQTRDLKKTMKENAAALAEFEKALIRKSEECNVSSDLSYPCGFHLLTILGSIF
jgi:hypothetical protein